MRIASRFSCSDLSLLASHAGTALTLALILLFADHLTLHGLERGVYQYLPRLTEAVGALPSREFWPDAGSCFVSPIFHTYPYRLLVFAVVSSQSPSASERTGLTRYHFFFALRFCSNRSNQLRAERLQITSRGFQFLLEDVGTQQWDLMLNYLRLAPVRPPSASRSRLQESADPLFALLNVL